ncbi:class I SAM-dependent DNA methyltransferase [Psychrobacter sp. I-STPA6b]|uniref:class I SAM-dependent DNA methyltransferase n=1 Tax=Psychrobacter sp. I-STPA6b TaxID=2585718 RepID=UPI001D0C48AB|nr:class I SAM-dependent methyltransferase [Psychrobacter sp. I-STPA6b]
MMDQKSKTLQYYDDHANDFVSETINADMQSLYARFIQNLANKDSLHILDLGCGSGRDVYYFANMGYQVIAIDGSQALINLAKYSYHIKLSKNTNISWQCLKFTDVAKLNWGHRFDGIWACASLLHVPYKELPKLIEDLLETLEADGVLYVSFKYGDAERVDNGRFFCDMNETRWQDIVLQLKTKVDYETWLSADVRPSSEIQWFNVMIKK